MDMWTAFLEEWEVGEKLMWARGIANDKIGQMEPVVVVLLSVLAWIALSTFFKVFSSAYQVVADQGTVCGFFSGNVVISIVTDSVCGGD